MKIKELPKEHQKQILKEIWHEDEHVPFCIERISDGSILYLNNDFETYSFEPFGNHMSKYYRWTYGRLFDDIRVPEGTFKVISWAPIDNMVNKPEEYFIHKFQKTELDNISI